MSSTKQKILKFLSTQQDCVVATLHQDGRPQAAVVGFSENDNLKIVFGTYETSRKSLNITKDARVAVVFGFSGEVTIQYEGQARLLCEPELGAMLLGHFSKLPEVEQYRHDPGQVYFCVEPEWVRYTNYSKDPWEIEELEEFS